jgi:hypothetical protein
MIINVSNLANGGGVASGSLNGMQSAIGLAAEAV